MYCKNCGAEYTPGDHYCSFCGCTLQDATVSMSLINKSVSVENSGDCYDLVLVSCGSCDKIIAGDLLEDIFGYTDAESSSLIQMAPVVIGERLNVTEAQTVAQLLCEYGIQVSIINEYNQYMDLSANAVTSVFDHNGNLLSSAAAVISTLTVANRIKTYRRFKKPSLLERIFRLNYTPHAPAYHRSFRPRINPVPTAPRQIIRKSPEVRSPRQSVRRQAYEPQRNAIARTNGHTDRKPENHKLDRH